MTTSANNTLFQITTDLLETGLRGYPVGYCTTSSVDPMKGLHYRGMPIDALHHKSPEEIMYLLFYGALPSKSQLDVFCEELQRRAFLDADFFEKLTFFPKTASPMKVFVTALLLAGTLYGTNDYTEDALNCIAKAPLIAGGIIRYLKGDDEKWSIQEAIHKKSWIDRLLAAMGQKVVEGAHQENLQEVMRLFMVLHMDHGGGNLSTFVGKAIASGLEDMYGSLAGALLALEGPRHGRANQDCIDFLKRILGKYGEKIDVESLKTILQDEILRGELIYGYGHAVLRVEDARATVFYDLAEKKYMSNSLVRLALLLRKVAPSVLSQNPKIADPYPNVDAISGPVLLAAGFPYTDCMPLLFGTSRIVGIARQIMYERLEARNGKGTPIVRPKYLYRDEQHMSISSG